jgi:hypothetical protein
MTLTRYSVITVECGRIEVARTWNHWKVQISRGAAPHASTINQMDLIMFGRTICELSYFYSEIVHI